MVHLVSCVGSEDSAEGHLEPLVSVVGAGL
jgi:hypothetical protein